LGLTERLLVVAQLPRSFLDLLLQAGVEVLKSLLGAPAVGDLALCGLEQALRYRRRWRPVPRALPSAARPLP